MDFSHFSFSSFFSLKKKKGKQGEEQHQKAMGTGQLELCLNFSS